MMELRKRKKFVSNNQAYSLLDALMGLFVMGFILFLLVTFITVLNDNYHTNEDLKQLNLFIMQIQEDIIDSEEIKVEQNKMSMVTYLEDSITYSIDEDKLIRKVNNSGYEILLNDLEEFQFVSNQGIIEIKVKFKDQEKVYEEVLTSEISQSE